MKTTITCVAVLLAFGFLTTAASADESYRFTLSRPSTVGGTELQPGDYKLVVNAPKAVLTEIKTGKSIEVQARVETANKKFETTEVHSTQVDGVYQLSEIRIGGSKARIAFD
jgi:hypothetical protein